jgi:hypothetical protein
MAKRAVDRCRVPRPPQILRITNYEQSARDKDQAVLRSAATVTRPVLAQALQISRCPRSRTWPMSQHRAQVSWGWPQARVGGLFATSRMDWRPQAHKASHARVSAPSKTSPLLVRLQESYVEHHRMTQLVKLNARLSAAHKIQQHTATHLCSWKKPTMLRSHPHPLPNSKAVAS